MFLLFMIGAFVGGVYVGKKYGGYIPLDDEEEDNG